MKGIRKNLLIHDATLKVETKTNDFETPSILETFLKRVRIDPSDKVVKSANNNEQELTSIMFFDIKNSLPKDQTFEKDQIIVFNGKEHTIVEISSLYDGKRLHHYEIGLV